MLYKVVTKIGNETLASRKFSSRKKAQAYIKRNRISRPAQTYFEIIEERDEKLYKLGKNQECCICHTIQDSTWELADSLREAKQKAEKETNRNGGWGRCLHCITKHTKGESK